MPERTGTAVVAAEMRSAAATAVSQKRVRFNDKACNVFSELWLY